MWRGPSETGEKLPGNSCGVGRIGPLRDLEVRQARGWSSESSIRGRAGNTGLGHTVLFLAVIPGHRLTDRVTPSFICTCMPACYKGQVPVLSESAVSVPCAYEEPTFLGESWGMVRKGFLQEGRSEPLLEGGDTGQAREGILGWKTREHTGPGRA